MSEKDSHIRQMARDCPVRNVAVVGLVNGERQILLVRTHKLPDWWQPIGGGVDEGDASPVHAVRRELLEEAKLDLPLTAFRSALVADYDFGLGKVYFFTAMLPGDAVLVFDSDELLEWKWFSLEEAASLEMFPATRSFVEHLK